MNKRSLSYDDKHQELLDNELIDSLGIKMYEVFGRRAIDNKLPKDGWQRIGIKNMDEIMAIISRYDTNNEVASNDVGEFVHYVVPPKSEDEEYLHLKIKSKI